MEKEEKLVRLEEMKDSINETLTNIEKVTKQQEMLIEVIESSDKRDEFKEFCNELKQQVENLNAQKTTLLHRRDLLDRTLFECEQRKTAKLTVLTVLDLFGIFEEN